MYQLGEWQPRIRLREHTRKVAFPLPAPNECREFDGCGPVDIFNRNMELPFQGHVPVRKNCAQTVSGIPSANTRDRPPQGGFPEPAYRPA